MHSHLAIIGKNGELALKPGQSISVTENNPMLNSDIEMFSQEFQIPFSSNRSLLKNMDARDSTIKATDVEGEKFTMVVDGLPLRSTVMRIGSDIVLNDYIAVNLESSNRTFKDMIADMRCRDVAVDDDILIGEKIGDLTVVTNVRHKWDIEYYLWKNGEYDFYIGHDYIHAFGSWQRIEATFQPPALGFSYPAKCSGNWKSPNTKETKSIGNFQLVIPEVETSYINTSLPYPHAKYCNSRICYAHHDGKENSETHEMETSSDIVQSDKAHPENGYDFSPYWKLDADRPASGICFYVAYFLECLFKQLGVAYDMSALTDISDFNYLCFFSTGCHYNTENTDQVFNSATFDEVNEWLSSRGCGGQIEIKYDVTKKSVYGLKGETWSIPRSDVKEYDSAVVWGTDLFLLMGDPVKVPSYKTFEIPIEEYKLVDAEYDNVDIGFDSELVSVKGCVQKMYANSDNFPDVDVSEVIESLESTFGVRFCYDDESNKVTVRLLRDMFSHQQQPIPFKGKVLSMRKLTEKITGVRVKYAAESDAQEQRDNIRYNKRDYDTTYNYIDYPEDRTKILPYAEMIQVIDIGNRNCYVDLNTGDAFRIKVNSEAETATELKPSAFEVGQLKGVEIGDCSEEADRNKTITEINSNFEPIITNNLKNGNKGLMLVPFIDEDMEHEFVKKIIQNSFSVGNDDYVNINYVLQLAESYNPSSTDDGQSPLMHHDWGLTVGILRPFSEEGGTFEYDGNYDGFGNSRWGVNTADYAVTADSYDVTGRFLGTDLANSFALKPRAWKPFLYYIDNDGIIHITTDLSKEGQIAKVVDGVTYTWLIPCNDDVRDLQGNIVNRIRSRGTCDMWLAEYIHFLLHRNRYQVKALCTAAMLANFKNNWHKSFEIGGKAGWVNMIRYNADIETGIGEVEIDFFSF